MSDYYVVESDSLSSVADAIREKTGKNEQLEFPDDFVSQIQDIESQGIYTDDEGQWIRPQGWPDLDALLDADQEIDVFYYTVDNSNGEGWFRAGLTTTPAGAKKILERGHVENGIFIVDETKTTLNNSSIRYDESDITWGNYPVFRLTHETGTITGLNANENATVNGVSTNTQRQPMVEAACRFTGSISINTGLRTYSVQKVRIEGKIKSLLFQDAQFLCKINAEDWDVSEMTSMANLFRNCVKLREIKCENWDVSHVTHFDYTFQSCRHLKKLDLSKWNNNISTNMSNMFQGDISLEELKFGINFDTSNVISMSNLFQACRKLKKIDISYFNTTNVTTMAGMFQWCIVLKEIIGADHLDTSAINQVGNYPDFEYCWNLEKLPDGYMLDLKSCTNTFSGSYMFTNNHFIELDLSNLKHSEIIIQPFLLSNSIYLKKIDYHGWDTSNFTGFHSYWKGAANVEYVNLDGWDLTHLSTISNFWNQVSIKEYYPPKIACSHSYNSMYNLNHASKLRILNILPETQDVVTLTLGSVQIGLTAEEIAIATQKGWTVA